MLQISQKNVCLAIFEGLTAILPSAKIKYNTEYTHVQITTTAKIHEPDLSERVMSILSQEGCTLYRPRWSVKSRFVAITNEDFADIEIRYTQLKKLFEYNIYIYISPTGIQFEWWYDRFMDRYKP